MVSYSTFEEVLCNHEDQVLVRKLLVRYVPADVKSTFVQEFNEQRRAATWRARVECVREMWRAAEGRADVVAANALFDVLRILDGGDPA